MIAATNGWTFACVVVVSVTFLVLMLWPGRGDD